MSFQPLLPLTGYAGWQFLQSTLETQQARFAENPENARDREYFKENIGKITSAEDLVSDYRLLRVALGAYGLSDDLPNKAFIAQVLSGDTSDDDALVNRLADSTYLKFSQDFGFGSPLPPLTQYPGFADKVLAMFDEQSFEEAVGDQDDDMRLALNAAQELPDLAAEGTTNTTGWLTVMGNTPLRTVFETAFGLPTSLATIDLDQQIDAFQAASERVLGSSEISQFSDPEAVDKLIQAFTLRSQIAAGPTALTPGATAITLLQNLV